MMMDSLLTHGEQKVFVLRSVAGLDEHQVYENMGKVSHKFRQGIVVEFIDFIKDLLFRYFPKGHFLGLVNKSIPDPLLGLQGEMIGCFLH